ncbi:HPr(Ser) kinase/phosphatase [Thauera mechernichensis]|uniref:HPr kinase/phosphorylase n=1 Tax=Thauera mechernichensis TaxID=82788 RepID=A0ABW3WBM1_9RHOO|nr:MULTISPECIES: HPr(Ser) kinase/phosphatase [Thauera]ENO80783.1 HPr kinase/phosphorylase [Thauera sp. 27]ENO90866.1 HPr kinase/phosphorylase [Thauera sp. 28]MDG3064271.1 HPr(Ser) kinase/phosphatase [Thauera mechernichensis]WBL63852.1 HPr(Ser) kinase/phosphatase [Thauera sp. WB-2]HNR60625.1 HPr(Ser) kinase/phosphatase [Thauera sp.]
MRQTSVARLYEAHRDNLQLNHISGNLGASLAVAEDRMWPADLVGHLNLIHPTRLQVMGAAELEWARRQSNDKVAHHLNEICSAHPPALIVADGCEVPNIVHGVCVAHDVALFSAAHPSASVIDQLRLYLSRELAEKTSLHGVFMDVLGLGVLITGDSGAGKSELALELISRGHGLVADDVVELSRIAPTVLEGRSPEMLQDFIEVRGLGILNIRTIFGETACRRKMRLRLICHLERRQPGPGDPSRLPLQQEVQDILGVAIARVVLPVAAGRNLAVLLEAAVRSTILQLRGIDSTQDFIERQTRAMTPPED